MSDQRVKHPYSLKAEQHYTTQTWEFISDHGLRSDSIKDSLEKETQELFPDSAIMVAQRQECELFELLLKFSNAKKCIEVGVFTGSSSISIARGIGSDGKLIALDVSEEFTNVARKYWREAGVEDRIELILGAGGDYLDKLISEGHEGTFDFAFVDADKESYDRYYEALLRLIRPGGLIAFDNVIWNNRVADFTIDDPSTTSLRNLSMKIIGDNRVKNVILPMADGINLVVKN